MKQKLFLSSIIMLSFLAIAQTNILELPQLEALSNNKKPVIFASTSIIADVVSNIAGDNIELNTLIAKGQDPHSFQLSARRLSQAAKADVIFVNGWDLEENLIKNLENIADPKTLIPVSAGIVAIETNSSEHGNVDPHVWFSIDNVVLWAKNIAQILKQIDPERSESYDNNLKQYLEKLADLKTYSQTEISKIAAEKRILVTNHNSFAYFARNYGFRNYSIINSVSNLAEPSARDLAKLIKTLNDKHICTIFSEVGSSDKLAKLVSSELKCSNKKILPLFTGSLSQDSSADSYIKMYKANLDNIVLGLK